MTQELILGTAGHIDHGKTALIRALTGIDTDRLPEEKRRGITIELGFAHLTIGDLRLGIVDVPGHERFVRQMLAGATGMDLVMLIVAADESVKPQTREHLDVLQFLRVPAGVIVLTKCDAADPDWIDLVEAEVRELVEGTFLERAPLVRTSATQGTGLDELRGTLERVARDVLRNSRSGRDEAPFRLAIDRSFTVEGYGTIVTGSVASGRVRTGESLDLLPAGAEVRVRGLQNHDHMVDEVRRGQRAAINLAAVRPQDIHKGQELGEHACFHATQRLTAQLQLVPHATRPLKHRGTVRLHLGTDEWLTRVYVPPPGQIAPGAEAVVQFVLPRPAVAAWGQPFVIRSISPLRTVGGGIVLTAHAPTWRRLTLRGQKHIHRLQSGDDPQRVSSCLYFQGWREFTSRELYSLAGVVDGQTQIDVLREKGVLVRVMLSSTRSVLVHTDLLDDAADRLCRHLERSHDRQPRLSLLERGSVLEKFRFPGDPAILQAILQRLADRGTLRLTDRGIGLATRGPKLSPNEKKLYDALLQRFCEAGLQPPSLQECRALTAHNREAVADLLALAVSEGELVRVHADMWIHADTECLVRDTLRAGLAQGGLTVSQIREILQTSRKYAVPLCEYLDRIGFTTRQGDVRVLGRNASTGVSD